MGSKPSSLPSVAMGCGWTRASLAWSLAWKGCPARPKRLVAIPGSPKSYPEWKFMPPLQSLDLEREQDSQDIVLFVASTWTRIRDKELGCPVHPRSLTGRLWTWQKGPQDFLLDITKACPQCHVRSSHITLPKFWGSKEAEKEQFIRISKSGTGQTRCWFFM